MAYKATAIQVMIASPGDVTEERDLIREIVHTWNAINSATTNLILVPVGWETHISPEMGERAQKQINKKILKDADLLVGVFWTRLGTPTGESPSGTVEEINEHIAVGKPAMLYFSSKPVAPESLNPEQYAALKQFKAECMSRGLIEEYQNLEDFREKFLRQLSICVNTNEYLKMIADEAATALAMSSQEEASSPSLSDEAKILLLEATEGNSGDIYHIEAMSGSIIQTDNQAHGGNDAREVATWEFALEQLYSLGLVSMKSSTLYRVTRAGYELADTLRAKIKQ